MYLFILCNFFFHVNGRMLFMSSSARKYLSHILQKYLVPWTLWWSLRSIDCMKAFLQSLHANGVSPVCILLWFLRVAEFVNDFSQILQVHSFSPLCILWWDLRVKASVNVLTQRLHENCPSSILWETLWRIRVPAWLKDFHIACIDIVSLQYEPFCEFSIL